MREREILAVLLTAFLAVAAQAQSTDFFFVVEAGNAKDVQAAIDRGADVNAGDLKGYTPLMWACEAQHFEVIRVLLKAGADINARDPVHGRTPLMWAAMCFENLDEFTKLLDAGADAKIEDNEGKTALDYARGNWRFEGSEALRRLQEALK